MHAWDYVLTKPGRKSWDETKREYADGMIRHMERFIDGCRKTSSSITATARSTWSAPRQLPSRRPAWRGDDELPVRGHRPTPELGQMSVPGVERLYLVGPFSTRRRRLRAGARRRCGVRRPGNQLSVKLYGAITRSS